jgi:uncharacterized protein
MCWDGRTAGMAPTRIDEGSRTANTTKASTMEARSPEPSGRVDAVDDQHSLTRTLVLHLLPGALITVFYAGAAPFVRSLGFPSIMAIFLAVAFVLVPFELGYLWYRARKTGASLGSLILYRQPVPRGQFVALVVSLFAWSGLIFVFLFPPLDSFFIDRAFSWLPEWFFYDEDLGQYTTAALLVTWGTGLLLNGFAGPIVEEVYFRGYLLPRISRFGVWAPILNTVLFSLYHFFTPWQNIARIIWLLPVVYVTWLKRNIYLVMAVHVLSNIAGMLLLLRVLLG